MGERKELHRYRKAEPQQEKRKREEESQRRKKLN